MLVIGRQAQLHDEHTSVVVWYALHAACATALPSSVAPPTPDLAAATVSV